MGSQNGKFEKFPSTPVDRLLESFRFAKVKPHIPEGAYLLDIGAGDGAFLQHLNGHIHTGVGIDASLTQSVEFGTCSLLKGYFPNDFTEDRTFDVINVICADGDDWNTYNDGYSANYYASQNEDNRSWYLLGDVQAKGVDASGGVSILNPDRFNVDWKQMGTASVSVSRDDCTWFHDYIPGLFQCNNFSWFPVLFTCDGHTKDGDASSNVEGAPGFEPGRHTDITLNVKVKVIKYKEVSGVSNQLNTTVTAEVTVNYHYVKGKSTFQYGTETIIATSITAELERTEPRNNAAVSSWSVSVEFDDRANSRASASVSFDGASGSKSLEYRAAEE